MKDKNILTHPHSDRDVLFTNTGKTADFSFNNDVAAVFDDMVCRSVPFYDEMQRMTVELVNDFARDDTLIYDIGCATGTTLALIDHRMKEAKCTLIGIDNSSDMLVRAREKLEVARLTHAYQLECVDINKYLSIENASVVTMLLTLQFVRPLNREKIVRRICDGINKDGCFIIIEKITSVDTIINRIFIDHYYEFKRRNGYSDMEISNKREALENVLIPYRLDENVKLLLDAGFRSVETFFRWYNFCGIIAIK